jgi:hypothetical protein
MKLALAILLCILASCKSAPHTPEAQVWASDMQQIGQAFSSLLPLSLNPAQFNDPRNKDLIDEDLTRLSHFTHEIASLKKKPSDDPSFKFASEQFNGELNEAKHQIQLGNRSYARFLIKNASNYCISCHTQTSQGPTFLSSVNDTYFGRLNPFDQADYLLAVRNFDSGLKKYKEAMNSPDAALQPYRSLENATLKALAVAVRFKRDPALAFSILDSITESKWAPVYLQLSAANWRTSVAEWKREKVKNPTLSEARALLSKSFTKQVSTPLSRAGLIEALRSSAAFHELLQQKKPGKQYAEVLYLTGLASEGLKDLDPFLLNETYYEACIQHFPHSEIAKTCYIRLEGAELGDYAALDGVVMPAALRDRLAQLKKLAEISDNGWKVDDAFLQGLPGKGF